MYNALKNNFIENLKAINANTRAKKISPFYFLYGNEQFFIESVVKNIKKTFSDPTGLNLKKYDDTNFDIKTVINYLPTLPIMNDKKLIIFDNITYFKNGKDGQEDLINAFNISKEYNIVIIICYANSKKDLKHFDSDNKVLNYVKENGVVLNSKTLDDTDINKYIVNYFAKNDKNIDKVEAAFLIKTAGKRMTNLFNEADKIISFLGDRKDVVRNDIIECVSRNLDDDVYSLVDLINANKLNEALKLYGTLLTENNSPQDIFRLLSYNYEKLLYVKDLTEKGKSAKEISEIIGIETWRVSNFMKSNNSTTKQRLKNKIRMVSKLNVDQMKSNIDERSMLEIMFN